MTNIFAKATEIQNKLSDMLNKEDLQNLYGEKEGKLLWNTYRNHKRDLWSFF